MTDDMTPDVPGRNERATLSSLGLESETPVERRTQDVVLNNDTELEARNPDESTFRFRDQLTDDQRAAVTRIVPELSERMVSDFNEILTFGSDVLDEMNSVNVRILDEQKNIGIPEADVIVNGILREIDGYSSKYSNPQLRTFFQKLQERIKGSTYTLRSMIRDAKPLSDRIDMAAGQIYKMELSLRDNVNRGHELRNEMIRTLHDVVTVIAVFEGIIEYTRSTALRMNDILDRTAGDGEDARVEWNGRRHTVSEFRELLAQYSAALGEIEKTWFSWRQKFFLYTTNTVAARNIINSSFDLQRTCERVRRDAIPAARAQIVMWQQAELARQGSRMTNEVNEGVDRLIRESAAGTASAVSEAAEAGQRNMLSEETVLTVTRSLRDQFESIVRAENEGRRIRSRNLAVIQQSEKLIRETSDSVQKRLISDSMRTVRSDDRQIDNGSDDILGLGTGEARQ